MTKDPTIELGTPRREAGDRAGPQVSRSADPSKEQCCPLDDDHDGNCAIHSAPGVFRNKAMQEALTSNLVSVIWQMMYRLADLLDDDHFNNIEGIVR